jgi:hypothetical protein
LPGFHVSQVKQGPGSTVGLVFEAVAVLIRITFRCVNGTPAASVDKL